MMLSRPSACAILTIGIVAFASCNHVQGAGPVNESAEHTHTASDSHAADAQAVPNSNAAPSTQSAIGSAPLILRAALSHPEYSQSAPAKLLLKIDIEAATNVAPSGRRPMNLALLIDTSGSMDEDEKFKYAMQAAELMVENLRPDDVVSIVAFSANALVLSPAGKAANKDFLHHRLQELTPQGWTNLSSGLLEAFAQIDSARSEEQLQHVIVITDGNANRGVTSSAQLAGMAVSARVRGIGLSTFGLGTDFDESVLIALADAGGGRYTYIRTAEQIPDALAVELDGLLEVIAQNVQLEVQPMSNTGISRAFGQLAETPAQRYSYQLGDFRGGDQSFFLYELSPRRFDNGAAAGADITLTWDDPATSSRQQRRLQSRSSYASRAAAARSDENIAVELYANVLDQLERAEEALKGLDTERFHLVQQSFDRVHQEVREHAIATRDQQLLNQAFMLKHFMSELTEANDAGITHGHEEAQRSIEKEINYRRYLLQHHRSEVAHQ